jgi:hypothetical protein
MAVAGRWCVCLLLVNVACVIRDNGTSGSNATGTDAGSASGSNTTGADADSTADDGWLPRPDTPAPEPGDPGYDDALAEPCEAVQLDGGSPTQMGSGLFVDCDPDGEPTDPLTLLHRVEAVTCYYGIPATESCPNTDDSCATDQDCTEGKYGRCLEDMWGGCDCVYDCVTDADCAADEACLCGSKLLGMDLPRVFQTQCYSAGCRNDDDCPGDFRCMVDSECGWNLKLRCQTPNDECVTTADCLAAENEKCLYSWMEERWLCTDCGDSV